MRGLRERLIDGALTLARRRAGRRLAMERPLATLVIPPAGAGSVGDAAMLNATCEALRARGAGRIVLALPSGWAAVGGYDGYEDWDEWFFGDSRRALARAIGALGSYGKSVMIGADCIDGTYNPGSITRRLTLLDEHARIGGRTRLLGSSFGLTPHPLAVERLRSLHPSVTLCARDPLSCERLEVAIGRPVHQTADLAFLVEPDPQEPAAAEAIAFLAAQRAAGRRVVGLNLNYLVEAANPGFAAAHRELIDTILDRNGALLLVPHDSRGEVNDESLLRAAVAHRNRDRVALLPPLSPAATKAALGGLAALVTSRMHAAILAIGAGTPALSFHYAGKFQGLYQLLGLDDLGWLFDPAELVRDPPGTTASLLATIEEAVNARDRVEAGAGAARALALANFA